MRALDAPPPPATAATPQRPTGAKSGLLPDLARRRPITLFLAILLIPTWLAYGVVLVADLPFMAAQVAELVFLIAAPLLVTRWSGGPGAARRLYRPIARWRLGPARYAQVLLAMPVATLAVALATGSLRAPDGGWLTMAMTYALFLVVGAATGNLWEESAWGGFAQGRLMARHGLLVGSLLTAIPFVLIHLPLAFSGGGLAGTTGRDVLITWAYLIVLAPFMRYLIGTVLIDSGGSVLAAALLHASMNAAGGLAAVQGSWQYPAALIAVTVLVVGYRGLRGRSAIHGSAPSLAQ